MANKLSSSLRKGVILEQEKTNKINPKAKLNTGSKATKTTTTKVETKPIANIQKSEPKASQTNSTATTENKTTPSEANNFSNLNTLEFPWNVASFSKLVENFSFMKLGFEQANTVSNQVSKQIIQNCTALNQDINSYCSKLMQPYKFGNLFSLNLELFNNYCRRQQESWEKNLKFFTNIKWF